LKRFIWERTSVIRNLRRLLVLGTITSGTVFCAAQAVQLAPNFFSGDLFPTGYVARINRASIGRAKANKAMRRPTDKNPMRVFATNIKHKIGTNSMSDLGQQLFNDRNLSNPAGQSCASCHSSQVSFSFPDSRTNLISGTAPGAVPGRFGKRLPPSLTYAVFSPTGPYYDPDVQTYVGGQFWDGRAADQAAQAQFPEFDPNEMNNIHNLTKDPHMVISHIQAGSESASFKKVFGDNAFSATDDVNMARVGQAIAAYEKTTTFSPFTSKYDAYLAGSATLTNSEMNGLRLFTGSASGRPGGPPNLKDGKCTACHGIPEDPTSGPDVFSNFCYTNIGVPKNPRNPFYTMTNAGSNPLGYNKLGPAFIDLGLGDFLYPAAGLPSGNTGAGNNKQGDFLAINGTFKAPSVRNVDKRPYPGFVRAYMHNGVFKNLKDVVHFYNTRNLTTVPGEVIDFTKANPYAGLRGRPLHDRPEFISAVSMNNPTGSTDEEVGNLGLTPNEEDDIVAFLKTLSDGYRGH
jgi:cytochrome c peroxidase